MQEGAAHVQALAARPGEHERRNQVHHHPRERHDEHQPAANLRRRDEPADGGVHDQHAHDEERDPVHVRRQDLEPAEAERPPSARGPSRVGGRRQGEPERRCVREHVPGVGQQRERTGGHTEDHFAGHQPDDQDERNREGAPPGAAVRVVVAGHATHCGFTALRQASHLPGAEDFALLRSRYGLRARQEKRAGPALAGNGSAPDLADDEAAL